MHPATTMRDWWRRREAGTAARSTVGAAPSTVVLEPGYVVHRRLYFEEKNAERYGWDEPVQLLVDVFQRALGSTEARRMAHGGRA